MSGYSYKCYTLEPHASMHHSSHLGLTYMHVHHTIDNSLPFHTGLSSIKCQVQVSIVGSYLKNETEILQMCLIMRDQFKIISLGGLVEFKSQKDFNLLVNLGNKTNGYRLKIELEPHQNG